MNRKTSLTKVEHDVISPSEGRCVSPSSVEKAVKLAGHIINQETHRSKKRRRPTVSHYRSFVRLQFDLDEILMLTEEEMWGGRPPKQQQKDATNQVLRYRISFSV
eukprot:9683863-Ditylum_brightwellii.AAC.1